MTSTTGIKRNLLGNVKSDHELEILVSLIYVQKMDAFSLPQQTFF